MPLPTPPDFNGIDFHLKGLTLRLQYKMCLLQKIQLIP